MAQVSPMLQILLDPRQPVQESVAAIATLVQHNPGHEEAILQGVKEAIERMQSRMKGAEKDG